MEKGESSNFDVCGGGDGQWHDIHERICCGPQHEGNDGT